MNASSQSTPLRQPIHHPKLHRICVCLGSNIEPEQNMRKAIAMLKEMTNVEALSACYETRAVGSSGPNFLNMAACLVTTMEPEKLKEKVLHVIEQRLGRVRTADKYAPRTMDLDVITMDQQVLDEELWQRAHLAVPFSELMPDLSHPSSGQTLRQIAEALNQKERVILRPEIVFS